MHRNDQITEKGMRDWVSDSYVREVIFMENALFLKNISSSSPRDVDVWSDAALSCQELAKYCQVKGVLHVHDGEEAGLDILVDGILLEATACMLNVRHFMSKKYHPSRNPNSSIGEGMVAAAKMRISCHSELYAHYLRFLNSSINDQSLAFGTLNDTQTMCRELIMHEHNLLQTTTSERAGDCRGIYDLGRLVEYHRLHRVESDSETEDFVDISNWHFYFELILLCRYQGVVLADDGRSNAFIDSQYRVLDGSRERMASSLMGISECKAIQLSELGWP